MATSGLSTGSTFLIESSRAYFADVFENPPFPNDLDLYKTLGWRPELTVELNRHLTILVEPSEELVYPQIFRLRHADIVNLHRPISVYSVCPLEVANSPGQQGDIQSLESHGIGLLTVDRNGVVARRLTAIPLIQHISTSEFKQQIAGLPLKLRRRFAEAFDNYRNNAPSGVSHVAEIIEGMILKAGRDAVRKSWLTTAQVRPGRPAVTLDALSAHASSNAQNAAWGGARNYIHHYRNTAQHFPANKNQAATKYRECRHAFLAGIQVAHTVYRGCRMLMLSGSLP